MNRLQHARTVVLMSSWAASVGNGRAQSALEPASSRAAQIEGLYWLIFWVSLSVFVVIMYAFTHATAKTFSRSKEPLPVTEDPVGDRRATPIVLCAFAISAITLTAIFFESMRVEEHVHALDPNDALTIEITGHQWWWEVRYPNSQADLTVVTANEIHVPVGKAVQLLTRSDDVIHSFWAPNIHGKRDLLPGQVSSLALQVDKPGRYRGICAEFCGYQHAHMAFEVVAESTEDFDRWLAQQRASSHDPQDEVTMKGRDVFLKSDCIMCHTIRGTPAGSRVGPDLTHVGGRRMIAAGTLLNTPGSLGGWISDAQRVKPGVIMPAHMMAPDDLQALIAYIRSLK